MRIAVITMFIGVFNLFNVYTQFPDFRYHEIGETDTDLLGQASLADIDKDDDLDFIIGSSAGPVWWFEYQSAGKWIKHLLGRNVFTDKGGIAFDVDGDGWIDQVAGGTWYRNTGNPREEEFERFENGAIYTYDNIAGDLNNDGKPELISLSEQEGLYIYQIPDKPDKKWKKMMLGEGINGGIYPNGIADIDGDKDMDLVRSNIWYENEVGDGSKWSVHRTISFVQSTGQNAYSSRIMVLDFDKDGDVDVIQAESNNPNGKIAWHANKDGKGINWFTHKIDYETNQDLHSLCVADFDNDGDMDVFSGGGPMTGDLTKRCFIWENKDGNGDEWIRHEILTEMECIDAVAGDVDGDGDIDICSKPWRGTTPYFLENRLIVNE
ncbi:MAG: VCBS repeat-containing protein [Bacteroidales bacterium]|nr:VCBS repeat-containing protein [Bacteroidales bacterium]MBN2763220.1 VCBS repeat-containing protein [Bacteroidales bacterium]